MSQVAAYRYDPFGTLLATTGTFDQPFQFSTKRADARIGMVQYEFRNYLPAIGRWMTRDPLGEAGGLNLYAFVGNNPVNWLDPWGLRIINESTKTIPIVINPILEDGTQGKQVLWHLPPGGDTEKMLPGYDTDGIYPPCNPKKAIKLVNGVTAVITKDGKVQFPNSENSIKDTIAQSLIGGEKYEDFIKQWNWPTPNSCSQQE